MRLNASLTILILAPCIVHAQRDVPVRQRIFQISVAPGLGTNGFHPGGFENIVSVNLTSGYSASNLLFEFGGDSGNSVARSLEHSGELSNVRLEYWPAFSAGVLLH